MFERGCVCYSALSAEYADRIYLSDIMTVCVLLVFVLIGIRIFLPALDLSLFQNCLPLFSVLLITSPVPHSHVL